MPTYDYECKGCGNVTEVFQSITDSPLKKCAKCGGRLKRLIGAGSGIIFKGSGFYATDYRSADYKKKEKEALPGKGSAVCPDNMPCAKTCAAKNKL